jgi:hypothetical protein
VINVSKATMLVLVDENIGAPSCEFSQGPDLKPILDMTLAIELCEGSIFPTIEEAEDCVFSHAKVDDAVGSCRPVKKHVSHVDISRCEYTITVSMGQLLLLSFFSICIFTDSSSFFSFIFPLLPRSLQMSKIAPKSP